MSISNRLSTIDGSFSDFENPLLFERYVNSNSRGEKEITLSVEEISCSGCVSRIESRVITLDGVLSIQVNPSTHRAIVVWDDTRLNLADLLGRFSSIGYPATPYQNRKQENITEDERRTALIRIAVSAALGMQVMMIATALYFGDAYGMEERFQSLLRLAAMFLTIPVLVFCGAPFFKSAWRNLSHRIVGVDVPVSLALLVAFAGSVATTLGYPGQVYYESIVMFVFLLLSARYLELAARRASLSTVSKMGKSMPEQATRLDDTGKQYVVDVNYLKIGDQVRIGPGEIIPADGRLIEGSTTVSESVLTGESTPINKCVDDEVIAGGVNIENGITIQVTRMAHNNALSQLMHLTERAQSAKPNAAKLADRISGVFVIGILVLAFFSGTFWWFYNPSMWLPVVVSTLVVACPCALSMATPTAFVAAMSALTRKGIVPVKSNFLEDLATVNHIVFDKTGTLTDGELSLQRTVVATDWEKSRALSIATALNCESKHPLAVKFRELGNKDSLVANDIRHTLGGGVTGTIDGEQYAVGSIGFITRFLDNGEDIGNWVNVDFPRSVCLLATRKYVVARFEFTDKLRGDAKQVVSALRQMGFSISLLSGDHELVVKNTADRVGIDDHHAGLSPSDKLKFLEGLQSSGKHVAVFGDGLNDAPILAAGTVSFAMGQGADLAKINADVVLLNNRLSDVLDVFDIARRTRLIIKQNFAWAIAYNLLAIPAALTGLIPPWLAAIGMSTSSLIVSSNALRLLRTGTKTAATSPTQPNTAIEYA
jgi:Cu2+-exporting ATPase